MAAPERQGRAAAAGGARDANAARLSVGLRVPVQVMDGNYRLS
jgi:hypothetical protein